MRSSDSTNSSVRRSLCVSESSSRSIALRIDEVDVLSGSPLSVPMAEETLGKVFLTWASLQVATLRGVVSDDVQASINCFTCTERSAKGHNVHLIRLALWGGNPRCQSNL